MESKRHYVGCPSLLPEPSGKCTCEFIQAFCAYPPWAEQPNFKGEITHPDLSQMLDAMTWGGVGELAKEVNRLSSEMPSSGNLVSRYFMIEEMASDGTVVYLDCKLAKPPREIRPGVFEVEFQPPTVLSPPLIIERVENSDSQSHADWRALND